MENKKRLTTEEFKVLRTHLERRHFEDKNIDAIRRVLVDGVMQKIIVAELGLTKEAVSSLISRAWKIHAEYGDRPHGWRRVEVVLPPDYADMVEGLAKAARNRVKK